MNHWLDQASKYAYPLMILLAGALALFALWTRFLPRIYSREKMYGIDIPFSLCGKPDLIMQELGGLLVIHDHKTRKSSRVYDSDVLQLSLYAILVAGATGRKVADYGVIRAIDPRGGLVRHRVPLIKDARLHSLHDRFMAVASQPAAAKRNGPHYLCKQCGFHGRECPGRSH